MPTTNLTLLENFSKYLWGYAGCTESQKDMYFILQQKYVYKNRYYLQLLKMYCYYSMESPQSSKHFCQHCMSLNIPLQ
jgi:hypothetical protein